MSDWPTSLAEAREHIFVLRAEIARLQADNVLLRREIGLMQTLVYQDEIARHALEKK